MPQWMESTNAPVVVEKVSSVKQAIKELASEVSHLEEVHMRLTKQLRPITRGFTRGCIEKEGKGPPGCDIAAELSQLTSRICQVTARLRGQIEYLEI